MSASRPESNMNGTIHNFKSDLINNMDHMGTEASSVILLLIIQGYVIQ